MLIGEYQYGIDAKGRLNFPVKLREDLGTRFIIAKGLGKDCLFVYSLEEWQNLEKKIKALPLSKAGAMQSFFFASACEAEPDKQGRIVIPANLREYGALGKDVVVIGVCDHCEIWNKDRWAQLCAETDSQAIARAMEDLGL